MRDFFIGTAVLLLGCAAAAGCGESATGTGGTTSTGTGGGTTTTSAGTGGGTTTTSAGTGGGGGADITCTPRALPMGRAPGSNELQPGAQRLRAATSTDGIHFTRLAATIADRAATPSLTRTPDGRPMLYMTATADGGGPDAATVAIGSADGLSWTHCEIERTGFPQNMRGTDPDVVRRADGSYRLYMTGPISQSVAGIHYADSSDGVHWTYGGIAFSRATSTLDSMTFEAGGAFHQYALDATSIAMVHGSSPDGTSFSLLDTSQRLIDGQPYVLSQAALVEGQLRIYAFGPKGKEIRSFTTEDGTTLTGDDRLLLSIDGAPAEESLFVKDPAVTALPDGTYLMVYSTVIP